MVIFVGVGSKMFYGVEYYVIVIVVNIVDMMVNVFFNKIGVDIILLKIGVVVDLNFVYRIDVKSVDEIVCMNVVICKIVVG